MGDVRAAKDKDAPDELRAWAGDVGATGLLRVAALVPALLGSVPLLTSHVGARVGGVGEVFWREGGRDGGVKGWGNDWRGGMQWTFASGGGARQADCLMMGRVLRDTRGQGVPQVRGSCRTETGCAKLHLS